MAIDNKAHMMILSILKSFGSVSLGCAHIGCVCICSFTGVTRVRVYDYMSVCVFTEIKKNQCDQWIRSHES